MNAREYAYQPVWDMKFGGDPLWASAEELKPPAR
jgi:hypothetical protein